MHQFVVTAVGPDRPGIVEQLTGHLLAADGNVLDSRMVNLRGQFAVVMLVEAHEAAATELQASLARLAEAMGLRLILTGAEPCPQAVSGIPFQLKTYSLDRPGIVHRVSEMLRQRGVNIEELATRQTSAPFAGAPLFLMEMRVTVPSDLAIHELRGELQALCDDLNCDLDFEPA
ncbi:MAG: ACT domain-containing protein [Candidatus Latescibacterota bacterium]